MKRELSKNRIGWLVLLGVLFASQSAQPSLFTDESKQKIQDQQLSTLCNDLRLEFKRLSWKIEPCEGIQWKVGGTSVENRPLIYTEFGNPDAANTTLIFTMVHSDEIPSLYLGIQLAHWLKEHEGTLKDLRVVIAPMVNPDGFFKRPRTRTNARGVDLNRNFSTSDWEKKALVNWKNQYRSHPRRYPGPKPNSEPETLFQQEIIERKKPQKILSVHSPLNFIDYDGPTVLSLARFPREYVRECLKLRRQLKATSGRFYPGSLGNYAGQERGIPTMTLELPSSNAIYARAYWERFRTGIRTMIEFRVPELATTTPSPSVGGR
ncbi:hypothetical protein K2X30_05125 [bacterium]|nr:hypothetical protein [bacterium]